VASGLGVLVVAGQPVFRAGLRVLLDRADDLRAAGETADAGDAARAARLLRPDVVVLDLPHPGRGFEAVARLARAAPDAAILVLAAEPAEAALVAVLAGGGLGLLRREAEGEDIVQAVRGVARRQVVLGASAVADVLDLAAASSPVARAFPELRDREREVLVLLAGGASNGQIARTLHLSPKTIRNHVSAICGKLAVPDRVGAALRARDAGIPAEAA
jgi:DNA-binding NarL/FixJ family response regulator